MGQRGGLCNQIRWVPTRRLPAPMALEREGVQAPDERESVLHARNHKRRGMWCFHREGVVAFQDPFTGMQRGKDYQLCPKCQTPINLAAGCNHLMCGCGTSFCYICGLDISLVEMDHFAVGMPCPRYNQPGTSAALYDPVEIEDFDWALDIALFDLAMLRFEVRQPTSRRLVWSLSTALEDMAIPEPVTDQLMDPYELFFARHEAHLASIESRLDVLWEPVTDVLPPWMDKRLYRKLTWPRSNRHAHSTVDDYYTKLIEELHSDRMPLPQLMTFHRLAKAIMALLDRHVAYQAINDPHVLRQLVEHAAEARTAIDQDVQDAEVSGWWSSPHLGLRLAVEVYRSERDAFFEGARQRTQKPCRPLHSKVARLSTKHEPLLFVISPLRSFLSMAHSLDTNFALLRTATTRRTAEVDKAADHIRPAWCGDMREVERVLLELVDDAVLEVELELSSLLEAVVVACRVATAVVVLFTDTTFEDVLVSAGSAKAVTVTVMITSPSSAGALDRGRMEVVSCP
ncbi:hypothetical protein KC344_g99 [Hortaea werneckii]|nr:hypothetical protein KC344_g99 [Hortaea werneckii]